MSSQSAVLVEGVAQALSWAISDPLGHFSWNTSVGHKLTDALKARAAFAADDTGLRCSACHFPRGEMEAVQAATIFDSSVVPPIGIDKYLTRLHATFRCSNASFIAALILADRLLSFDSGRLPLTMRNVHRLFFACLVVAVKYNEDQVYSNGHYAKAGGVHLKEVNRLERVLLASLNFHLRVLPEEYQLYHENVMRGLAMPCGGEGRGAEAGGGGGEGAGAATALSLAAAAAVAVLAKAADAAGGRGGGRRRPRGGSGSESASESEAAPVRQHRADSDGNAVLAAGLAYIAVTADHCGDPQEAQREGRTQAQAQARRRRRRPGRTVCVEVGG